MKHRLKHPARVLYRLFRITALMCALSLTVFVGQVEATDGLRGNECIVEAEEIIVEDFYFFCNTLVVHGLIDGDMVGFASEVTLARTGRVTGDIWVFSGQLTIEGIVGDDVHYVGADMDISGLARFPNVGSDIISAGISMELAEGVVIPGDVIYNGYQAVLDGKINGNVDFQGQALTINDAIAGNVDAVVGDQEGAAPLSSLPLLYSVDFEDPGIHFGEAGHISGYLSYQAPQRAPARGSVGGPVIYTQSIQRADITEAEQSETFLQIAGNYILTSMKDITALAIVGLLALNFAAPLIKEPGYRVQTRSISAFSWGLVLLLLMIPTGLLLLLTSLIILAVVAIITLFELTIIMSVLLVVINLGFFGGFFFLLVFLGRVITCFVLGFVLLKQGQALWKRYGQPPKAMGELWFALMLGTVLISALVNLPLGPVVGTFQLLITGIVACAGLGGVFMYLRDLWYFTDRRSLSPRRPTRYVPPPPDDFDLEKDVPLGMDNLPPGFSGFD